jgi:hypothetical protein
MFVSKLALAAGACTIAAKHLEVRERQILASATEWPHAERIRIDAALLARPA